MPKRKTPKARRPIGNPFDTLLDLTAEMIEQVFARAVNPDLTREAQAAQGKRSEDGNRFRDVNQFRQFQCPTCFTVTRFLVQHQTAPFRFFMCPICGWSPSLRVTVTTQTENYYQILRVTRSATSEEIRTAYRKLAVQFHPDRNLGNPQAEEKFKKILDAYECLRDPEKRAYYDRYGKKPRETA